MTSPIGRDRIIAVALAVSEYGLERLTYQAVANRLGCDPGTIKNHFKNGGREEMRAAVIDLAYRTRNRYVLGQICAIRSSQDVWRL